MAKVVGYAGSNNGGGATTISVSLPTPYGPWYTNTTGTATFRSVAYGDGYWVAVGDGGVLYYKADLPTGTWTSNAQGTSAFYGVAYGGGYWVAVGASGTLYYKSTDPTGSWTSNAQGTTTFRSVAYGGGYWTAVGDTGTLYHKQTDPTSSWTSNAQGSANFTSVAYGDTYWVAVGASGTLYYKQTDPTSSWTSNAQGVSNFTGVAYGDGYWAVAASQTLLYKATDPSGSWTNRGVSLAIGTNSIGYGNGYWLYLGSVNAYIATTAPTGTFTNLSRAGSMTAVGYGNGYFTVVGTSGLLVPVPTYSANDVAVFAVTVRGGTGTTITDPSGWTLLGTQVNSTTVLAQKLYWRVLDGTEGDTVSVTITSNKASAALISLRDVSLTAPASTQYAGTANASSATVTYPDIGTFPSANGIDLVFGGYARGDMVTAAPTNYTETTSSASTGGGSNSQTQTENAYRILSAQTAISGISATWTGTAGVNIGHHVFIYDAPAVRQPVAPRRAVMRSAVW